MKKLLKFLFPIFFKSASTSKKCRKNCKCSKKKSLEKKTTEHFETSDVIYLDAFNLISVDKFTQTLIDIKGIGIKRAEVICIIFLSVDNPVERKNRVIKKLGNHVYKLIEDLPGII